jgi:hypothetical protein
MPETLLLTMDDLKAGIADHLGYTRDSSAWTARHTEQIEASLNEGLRQAYFPPIVPGMAYPHRWTFMTPTMTLNTVADKTEYDLPENLFMIDGDVVIETSSPIPATSLVKMVSPEKLLMLRQQIEYSSSPAFCATRSKLDPGFSSPRQELMIYPTPDDEYPLVFKYSLTPEALSADAPYPLGGTQHSSMILASCRAAADALYNDNPRGGTWEEFMTKLTVSIAIDMRVGSPVFLGRNGNSRRGSPFGVTHRYGGPVNIE